MTTFRDAILVAGFELRRAMRSMSAMALVVIYVIATAGSAYGFIGLLKVLEDDIHLVKAPVAQAREKAQKAKLLAEINAR